MVGLSTIVPLEAADVFITDDEMPADAIAVLTDRCGEVVVARQGTAELPTQSGLR
jgi:hypothetical protein